MRPSSATIASLHPPAATKPATACTNEAAELRLFSISSESSAVWRKSRERAWDGGASASVSRMSVSSAIAVRCSPAPSRAATRLSCSTDRSMSGSSLSSTAALPSTNAAWAPSASPSASASR